MGPKLGMLGSHQACHFGKISGSQHDRKAFASKCRDKFEVGQHASSEWHRKVSQSLPVPELPSDPVIDTFYQEIKKPRIPWLVIDVPNRRGGPLY